MTRSSVADVLMADHVRVSRAMGLSRRRILIYVLKNALTPVVTVAAMSFGYMFGWALIIEQVFNIARHVARAAERDLPARLSDDRNIVLVITAMFLAANLIADLLYRVARPADLQMRAPR